MRIIAGVAGGRRLRSLGGATRPMMDRAREGLFSSLGAVVAGSRVLDLFAGTGSLGLEALSRGAASAVFVERDRKALDVLQANVAALGLGGEVVAAEVGAFLERPGAPFDLAFVDPPYALSLASVESVLEALLPHLAGGAVIVLHRRAGEDGMAPPAGAVVVDRRRYGDTEITRMVKEAT
jgi:16S rRNA (guanine966-N2)-methyltransferase